MLRLTRIEAVMGQLGFGPRRALAFTLSGASISHFLFIFNMHFS